MADSSKRPAQRALDRSPPTAPALLGALSPLPEVLLAHLCSFLSGRDLARLGGACAALHESPVSLGPRLRVGLREGFGKEDEEGRQRRAEALRMLARRAATGLKELQLWHGEVSEAFCSAMLEEGQPLSRLTSLHVEFPDDEQWEDEEDEIEARALACMLAAGQLPVLRELHMSANGVESVLPVWRAVGEGACPRLERIEIQHCSSPQLMELAEAMRARPKGCEELQAVRLGLSFTEYGEQAACEALQALLSRLSPRSLEELCLTALPCASLQSAIIPALRSGCAALKMLQLRFNCARSVDGLLHALARGAMPSLTSLDVLYGVCSDEAWRALGEAMGPEGTCLRRIKTLKLDRVLSSRDQLAILSRAMGSGHGCPELEILGLCIYSVGHEEEVCGAALAPAFRSPHGLPRLKELRLYNLHLTDLDQLVEALQHRPHASQPMEVIKLERCYIKSASDLGRAMEEGGSLASLKELTICSPRFAVDVEEWPVQLVEALSGGAGQQLEKIECGAKGLHVDVVNHLLQGLAIRGMCPRLQSLTLRVDSERVNEGVFLDACSLTNMLAGRAACSAKLREVWFGRSSLSNEGLRRVTACLREPQAVQLEAFELGAWEPDACEAVMELLSALGGRAGDKLRHCSVRSPSYERGTRRWRCDTATYMRVARHVVGIIEAGGFPAMHRGSGGNFFNFDVQRALQQRRRAQWLAGW